MLPINQTEPVLTRKSTKSKPVNFFFHRRKIHVYASREKVINLPEDFKGINSVQKLKSYVKNTKIYIQDSERGLSIKFFKRREIKKRSGNQQYSVTFNNQVVVTNSKEVSSALLEHQGQILRKQEKELRNLRRIVETQELTAQQLASNGEVAVTRLEISDQTILITLYQQHLKKGEFNSCAQYFERLPIQTRKILLDQLIDSESSQIFQLGFHLCEDIVKTEFPEEVAAIITNHQTHLFGFSLANDNAEQKGWEMAIGNFEYDKRNFKSFWVMAMISPGVKNRGSWKLIPQDQGRYFHICFSGLNNQGTDKYYLSSNRFSKKDRRDDTSTWLNIFQNGSIGNKWELRYFKDGTFQVALMDNTFGQEGWIISAQRDNGKDIRHELSTWMIAQSPQSENPCQWKIQKK